jgi:hypothetical protein
MSGRTPLAVLATCAALAVGLAACGGGSSSSPTSAAAPLSTDAGGSPSGSEGPSAAAQHARGKGPRDKAAPPGAGASEPSAAGEPGANSSSGTRPTAGQAGASFGAGAGESAAAGNAGARSASATPASPHRSTPKPTNSPGAAAFLQARGDNSIPEYGSEAPAAERAAGEAALGAYLSARAGGDWAGACKLLAAGVRKQLGTLSGAAGESCATAYATLSAGAPAAERADPLVGSLAALRVEAETAFALFYGPNSQQYMMPMQRDAGGWKVTQIAAIPYPPGAAAAGQ